MGECEFGGLRHECTDPECHVPAFITTLRLMLPDSPQSESSDPESIRKAWDRNQSICPDAAPAAAVNPDGSEAT